MKCRIHLAAVERYCIDSDRLWGDFRFELEVPDYWPPPSMWPDHVACFCPSTGQVWAWLEWIDPDADRWIVRYVPAPGQPARHRAVVPGSILPMDDDGVPDSFLSHPDLLEREFLVHAEYFKKGFHRL